ncbi:helix-turn-helix transcriptional regulator [Actinoplanes hulinensis]|uniref:Helix-turn-helix transcriptional regulator n=1 Tax=Actinoplanes hulinensis TaxID=1144547 RepID=A0ABS7AYR4_9ACTN|nr:helix-turn-helix transcriptional regulator [Actinoplanes hulinensis]MBW6433752.1 helix-turn-helix transcriptional regulator [Actinoplanes hulinensis]
MQRDRLITPEMAHLLRPWFSGVTVGAQPVIHDAPAVLEQPDHAAALTWRVGSDDPHDIVIMGPRTRARYHLGRPGRDCLPLSFRPGWAADFLGLPLRDLADRAVAAADLDSRSLTAFVEAIADSGSLVTSQSHAARLRSLTAALPDAPSAHGDRAALRRHIVAEATALLSIGDGSPRESVHRVARRLNVSERHLRTVFADGVGLTPSQFVRLDRVRAVLARIQQRLPEVSTRAGYYDQSHMTAEFHRVMGTTPYAFTTRRWPITGACTATTVDTG